MARSCGEGFALLPRELLLLNDWAEYEIGEDNVRRVLIAELKHSSGLFTIFEVERRPQGESGRYRMLTAHLVTMGSLRWNVKPILNIFAGEQRVYLPEEEILQAVRPKYFNHEFEESAPDFAKRVFDYTEALAKKSRK